MNEIKKKSVEQVWDESNSPNEPWLMNQNVDESYLDTKNNEPLTADYIWSCKGEEREALVKRVFDYLRTKSFEDIIPKLSKEELECKYEALKNISSYDLYVKDTNEAINSNSTCTDVLKHFCGELFYSAAGDSKSSYSCKEVFEDDDKLLKLLKNRMGYRTSKEDGRERPYVFSMSNKMVLQGMRSSGLGYSVSTFKPALAKFIIEHCDKDILGYKSKKVFDYSAGWGARALGVGSLGHKEYYGIDPLTYNNVNKLLRHYKIDGEVFCGGSENTTPYTKIINEGMRNTFDICFSSPPYFSLETYDKNDGNQSINLYPEYDEWLQSYWAKTVFNCTDIVLNRKKYKRVFVLVMLEKYKKFNLLNDMVDICKENGLEVIKTLDIRTSKGHLSGKIKSKEVSKNTEKIIFMR